MVKRFIMVMLAMLTIGIQAFAQNPVSGRVTDKSGEPVVGAGVLIKGTTTGTTTDLDGNWKLANVKPGAVLEISSIGYATQQVAIGNAKQYNVALEEDALFLDDVVVVGYGSAKRKDLTGSLTQIDGRLIAATNTSSATKALEGAIPGIVYSVVDAQPGNDAGIRVRGLGSTNTGASNALIIIDGVPAQGDNPLSQLNSEDIASLTVLKDAASTAIYGSRGANGVILVTTKTGQSGKTKVHFQARTGWNTVGTYDVGQIDDAAGIYEYFWKSIYNSYRYGVDGSGSPAYNKTTGEYYTNINTPNYTHEQAAEFASAHLFNYIGSETEFGRNYLGNYMAYSVPGAIYTADGTSATSSATMSGAYLIDPTTGKINPAAKLLYDDSYADALLKVGHRQQYDISASGGNEKENHYVSFGFMNDPSYVPSSNFQRITGRANLNVQLFPWLKVGTNINFTRSKTNYMAGYWAQRNAGSNPGSIPRFVNGHTPIIPFYRHDKNGNFIYDENGDRLRNVKADETYSPLGQTGNNYQNTDIWYALRNDVREDVTSTLNTRTYAEIPFLEHFTYRFDFAYDIINNMMNRYYNGTTGRAAGLAGYLGKRASDTQVINLQNRITYTQDFGKHHVDALALAESSDWEYEQVSWGSYHEFIPVFLASSNFVGRYGGAGSAPSPDYGHDIERMRSFLGRTNYIYDDTYYLSASIRRDGSSKFRADNRWGTFWSVGAGWRFSNEAFMEGTRDWLTNGKLRASYGVIGNQNGIGRYQTYRTWTYSATYASVTNGTGSPTSYKLGMGGFVNTALTWEETNTFDAGIDLTLFNRVDLTFDFFNRVTTNSQFEQPVSYLATGQASIPRNIAELTNRGIEFDINADIIRTKDLRWNVALNLTHYNTKLTGLPDDAIPAHVAGLPDGTWHTYDGGAWSQAGGAQQKQAFYLRGIGRDWYNIYMYKYAGVDDNSGLPLYWGTVTQAALDKEAKDKTHYYDGLKVGDKFKTTDYARATKQEIGDALPDIVGGFNTSLTWKNWDFSAQFAFQLGGYFFSKEYADYLYAINNAHYRMMFISKEAQGNTWTPEKHTSKFPMQMYPTDMNAFFQGTSANGQDWSWTTQSLFSASYLRLKNITIGYNAPAEVFKKLGLNFISGLRVFASADNLFLLSEAKGIDPSMSISGGYTDVDEYTFPLMRTYTIGINLDF